MGHNCVSVSKRLLDIEKTCNSGQLFRYKIEPQIADNGLGNCKYNLISIDAFIDGEDRHLSILDFPYVGAYNFLCDESEYLTIWEKYFDIAGVDSTYAEFDSLMIESSSYLSEYLEDPTFLERCEKYSCGITILNQDPWETIVSFIISQNNNIPRIKSILAKICDLNGGKFPNPVELYNMDLSECSLGYRKKYLEDLAEDVVTKKFDPEFLRYYKYPHELDSLIKELKKLNGVGDKVANCIALYGYHFLNAFPVDVWVKRIIDNKFRFGSFKLSNNVNDPFCKLERSFRGLTQQYMYYYAINHKDEFK